MKMDMMMITPLFPLHCIKILPGVEGFHKIRYTIRYTIYIMQVITKPIGAISKINQLF